MLQTSLSEIDYTKPEEPKGGTAFGGLLDIAGDLDKANMASSKGNDNLSYLNTNYSFDDFGTAVRDIIDGKDKISEAEKPIEFDTYENKAFDAYSKALADGKHTMILFSARPCGFCKTMKDNLASPELAKYSKDLVAAVSYRGEDEGGDHLGAALNIQRYPTTIILKTDMDRLHVVGRIEGVFKPQEISKVIDEALKEKIEPPNKNESYMV